MRMRNKGDVGCLKRNRPPVLAPFRGGGIAIENRIGPAFAANVGPRKFLGVGVAAPNEVRELADGRWCKTRQDPGDVAFIGNFPHLGDDLFSRRHGEAWDQPALTFGLDKALHHGAPFGRHGAHQAFTILRYERI